MNFKELLQREKHVVVHGQSSKFRLIKWIVILCVATFLYRWNGWAAVSIVFVPLGILGIGLHFFLRWKSKGWTEPWGPYKKVLLNKEYDNK